ncbi:MAG: GAF domain-containing protein [Drouetiella hepatica Uher 2000/2452]|jgi:two-component system sensor histidine kinase/response regulator|uniref:Circadian input-output histidine kinase CikA n=1 Tax=Drouetiella hepatica Uher 2000/2452 TaxID=904376 RepID=A0A951QGK7_9CYAN|nr:GAF domain-containing protein [Drouetiella hepatica Uher 2000/2452]
MTQSLDFGVMMPNYCSNLSQSFPFSAFSLLQTLIRQMAEELRAEVFSEVNLLNEGLTAEAIATHLHVTHFTLMVSPAFSILLLGKIAFSQTETVAPMTLTFEPEAIRDFLDQAIALARPQALLQRTFQQVHTQVQPNHAGTQSEFTLRLVAALSAQLPMPQPLDQVSSASSTEKALLQQIKQERLLNQVAAQIRQSLELPIILQTAVEQMQQCLEVDRLVIYRLNQAVSDAKPVEIQESSDYPAQQGGSVIYEARLSTEIPSVLDFSEAHCFVQTSRYQNVQRQNLAIAVQDVEARYRKMPCFLEFLQRAQIRSKLVAPITIGDRIWGLLIAHQCFEPRQWQEGEQKFLQQIAEHLAIAISQAQLYAELQQQKQTLEQRVIERTQALQDMVLASQSANRAKSEFLASVSHELRTPLTCIIGMSATLQRWSAETLSDRQQSFLQTIHDSGKHLLAMINDILDLSQAEASKIALNLEEFSLSRLAQQALKTFTGQAVLQEVSLGLDLQIEPAGDRFIADPHRIRQILFNLLGNAIKFTPKGGKVTLCVFVEDNLAVFQVKDTGIGIPEPLIPELFQKFQQLDTGYRRQYEGTGLGLALTKQLVDLHSGSIQVKSIEGIGTVFTVCIPMQRSDQQEPLLKEGLPEPPQGRVVLIEHNEETANLICDVLTAAGYQVIWMLEGSTAVSQIEALRPIAVITNMQLPDMDGDRLIHRLRRNPSTQHLKIIALMSTVPEFSSEEQNSKLNTGDLDVDGWLPQPVRPDHLLQKLMHLVTAKEK